CNEAVLHQIIIAFGISEQELGVTNQAQMPTPQPWLSSTPITLWGAVTPPVNPTPLAVELPIGFDGWTESDFIDRREMFALRETRQEWSYAQCKWLEGKMDQ